MYSVCYFKIFFFFSVSPSLYLIKKFSTVSRNVFEKIKLRLSQGKHKIFIKIFNHYVIINIGDLGGCRKNIPSLYFTHKKKINYICARDNFWVITFLYNGWTLTEAVERFLSRNYFPRKHFKAHNFKKLLYKKKSLYGYQHRWVGARDIEICSGVLLASFFLFGYLIPVFIFFLSLIFFLLNLLIRCSGHGIWSWMHFIWVILLYTSSAKFNLQC